MKIKFITAASIIALSSVSSASAADMIMRHHEVAHVVVKPVKTFSFTGLYIGGQAGYRWGKEQIVNHNPSYRQDVKGGAGGVFAGFNTNLDNGALFGIETDMMWNKLKGKHSFRTDKNTTTNGDHAQDYVGLVEKWSGATRLRAGYAQDHVLPYISGGVAYTKLEVDNRDSGVNPVIDGSTFKDKALIGWTVGAGVDYAATDNILVRLEYRYSDFGKKKYQDKDGNDFNLKYNTHDVRVGVAYKF